MAADLSGGAKPACQLVPPSFPGFRPHCPYQAGPADGPYRGPDVAKARALVAESGTAGQHVTINYGWLPDYFSPAAYYDYVANGDYPNYNRYCNRDIQARARQALALVDTDPTGALTAWTEIGRMLVDDASTVPTSTLVGAAVVSPSVGNLLLNSGGPILDQIWVR